MTIVEILEENTTSERHLAKDVGSKVSKTLQTKAPWKGKEEVGGVSKPNPYEVKKLSK